MSGGIGACDGLGVVPRLLLTSGLQAQTLVCKGLLLIVLARCLPVEEVGVFGILVGTLGLALYAVGLEFATFSTREIVGREEDAVSRMVRDQLVLHLLSYAVALPALAVLFAAGLLPRDVACWFLPLLVADHLGQELQRLLVTLRRPTSAALVLFVRQGAWVYVLLVLLWAAPTLARLETVLGCWLVGEAAALALGAYWLRGMPWRVAVRAPVDWAWIRRGLAVALPFAASSLALLASATLDRYAVRRYRGAEAAGVYIFYLSARAAIQSLLDVGVVPFYQPRLLLARRRGDAEEYRRLFRELVAAVVLAGAALVASAALLVGPVIRLIGRPIYSMDLGAFALVMLVPIVQVLVTLVQFALYCRHRDRPIVLSSLGGLAASLAANAVLVPAFGLRGAAVATLTALGVVGALGWAFLRETGVKCASPSS